MKIYTKTGDSGETGLLGGSRRPKNDPRIATIGDVDELNAMLGVARTRCTEEVSAKLLRVQSDLFELGAELAAPAGSKFDLARIGPEQIHELEAEIDAWTGQLPPLKAFILPGGGEGSAMLHLARSVCRRAERSLVTLRESEEVRDDIAVFVNRLSDWLFVAARASNAQEGHDDVPWSPRGREK